MKERLYAVARFALVLAGFSGVSSAYGAPVKLEFAPLEVLAWTQQPKSPGSTCGFGTVRRRPLQDFADGLWAQPPGLDLARAFGLPSVDLCKGGAYGRMGSLGLLNGAGTHGVSVAAVARLADGARFELPFDLARLPLATSEGWPRHPEARGGLQYTLPSEASAVVGRPMVFCWPDADHWPHGHGEGARNGVSSVEVGNVCELWWADPTAPHARSYALVATFSLRSDGGDVSEAGTERVELPVEGKDAVTSGPFALDYDLAVRLRAPGLLPFGFEPEFTARQETARVHRCESARPGDVPATHLPLLQRLQSWGRQGVIDVQLDWAAWPKLTLASPRGDAIPRRLARALLAQLAERGLCAPEVEILTRRPGDGSSP